MNLIIVYLGVINIFSFFVFLYDKYAAKKAKRRISERFLHLLEVLGGVFVIFVLMLVIRHKTRKVSYYVWTYLILVIWIVILVSQTGF